jgi:hypothetical protein
MQQSAELRELVLQTYAAMASGDTSFYEHHLARYDGVLVIGSDPDEWWVGYDRINAVYQAQLREMGGVSVVGSDPQAYRHGDAGWVADRPKFRLPDGSEIPIRITMVFAREGEDWKLVQQHISIGVPNQEVVGQDLTVSAESAP